MRLARLVTVVAVLASGLLLPAAGAGARTTPVGTGADRVVIVTLPGITWELVLEAHTPVLDRLAAEGSVAGMSVRTAARRTEPEKGYLTLGSGNRANVRAGDVLAHLALEADEHYEGGTAAEAMARRTGREIRGEIVHLGFPVLERRQDTLHYGTEAGALGDALAAAGIRRGVVSAADHSENPQGTASLRRSAVLGLVDSDGVVDSGRLRGLVTAVPEGPFGVLTDGDALEEAARAALADARVVLVEPGETARADEFVDVVVSERVATVRRSALERSDALVGRIAALLGPRDLLLVVAVSGPAAAPREQLTPLIAHGHEVTTGLLTSPATRRPGMATLTDVAPTILAALGAPEPLSMTGTPLQVVPDEGPERVEGLADLNHDSLLRERMTPTVVTVFTVLLTLLAGLAFGVSAWGAGGRMPTILAAIAYIVLAVPPATMIVRAAGFYSLGEVGAHLVLWAVVLALAGVASHAPGPRWAGGVWLLVASAGILVVDAVLGGPLQLNGIFGHSPIVAGRFYGFSNAGHPMLYSAGILGLFGLLQLRGVRRVPLWTAFVLAPLPLLVGFPTFGANFGGFIAGIPAVAVAFALGRRWRMRWRLLLLSVGVAVVLAGGLTLLDMSRPPEAQTHLGRFAAQVLEGGLPALQTVVVRKALSNIGLIGFTAWTLMIPVALAVIAALLTRPRGVLRDAIPRLPLLRAALFGAITAAVVGFVVNDSGIAIPAVVLGHVAPFLVLVAVQEMRDGPQQPPVRPPPEAAGRAEPAVPRQDL